MKAQQLTVIPDIQLPASPEECFPFRVAVDKAIACLIDLRSRADGVIAEHMAGASEKAVDGVVYTYEGTKLWETDAIRMLAALTALQQRGDITRADYEEAVTITPQPDLVRIDNRVVNRLVDKRGLTELNQHRTHREGPRKLRVKE